MNEEVLKTIIEFNKLPKTEEIKEINRQYLNDEISSFEFYCLAKEILAKNKS